MKHSILVDGREFVSGRRTGIGRFLEGLLLAIYEKHILQEALKKSLSIRKTADLLNVSHVTLLNKLKKHDIHAVRK